MAKLQNKISVYNYLATLQGGNCDRRYIYISASYAVTCLLLDE